MIKNDKVIKDTFFGFNNFILSTDTLHKKYLKLKDFKNARINIQRFLDVYAHFKISPHYKRLEINLEEVKKQETDYLI